MIVCLTEKPDVARTIAHILGAKDKRQGYFEGNGYAVTWTYGHLCTLKEPHDYTDAWKRWALSTLPMIPEPFGIKLIDNKLYKQQFNVIKSLIANASEVINCGDAGQEGELIQRWVMQKAHTTCPVKRLWTSSLTDEALHAAFSDLRPQSQYDNLYMAGLSRAVGDWILGLNATRLYSLKYSVAGKVLSIGRVQTPTLSLVVQRQLEIDNFVPEDYWEISTLYRDVRFNATSGKFKSEEDAQKAVDAIAGSLFVVTDVQSKNGRESAPRLFDLTSLQVECNKRWGWSADESLKVIQSLYEKKVTTYPRVDTTYLPDDIFPKVPEILRKMTPYAPITAPILAGKIIKSKKIFNNAKVTDHHAIIPTGVAPDRLEGNERKMYHLIARRFIAVFYPDCTFTSTTVIGKAGDTAFKATGKVIIDPGWRKIYATDADKNDDNNDDDAVLPEFTVGESGPHKPSFIKKTTHPPKYYTEGSLLQAMESAGRTVDDEELREAMKENGLGRPSTRANIIETLFKRGYMVRERKSIRATQAGIELIATIKEDLLKSAKLTGAWENKLRRIERGEYSPREFISELKQLIGGIVVNVLQDNSNQRINIVTASEAKAQNAAKRKAAKSDKPKAPRKPAVKSFDQIVCPVCGKGHIIKGRTAYGCSEFRAGCSLRLMFDTYPDTLTPAKLNTLIKKQYGK